MQDFLRLLACVLVAGIVFVPVVHAAAPELDALYVKQSSWAETMAACRAQYAKARGDTGLSFGPWYATNPLRAKGFADALFPEQGVQLDAKAGDGSPLWHARADWADGAVHDLPGDASVSTYLFRTITAAAPATVEARFGSDDGLAVWLNGQPVLTRDVPRSAAPNQDRIALELQAGENALLLKIYNRVGWHAFCSSISCDMAAELGQRVQQDFPIESGWLQRDIPGIWYATWFNNPNPLKLNQQAIAAAIQGAEEGAAGLQSELDALSQAGAAADDPRWLALYANACRQRDGFEMLATVNCAALRLAIQDLIATFPEQYAGGAERLSRLDALENALPETRQALIRGEETALAQMAALCALQREALLANPLLDFDKLLLVKRSAGNLGLPQNWQGNCAIARTGYDNEIAVLSPVAPGGQLTTFYKPDSARFVGDVDLHFDAGRMLLSMPGSHERWQIWELPVESGAPGAPRQVTPGEFPDVDNYDACYLPDGRIIFASTRCFQGIPCVAGSNTVANLCIMDADGGNIRQLCFDQDHNWCPTVLNNGRILYTRWEYADTPHYFDRLLFHMNPDGTSQMEYYGSNSYWPNSTFYARPVPDHPTRIVAIVSGHHGVARMGELVLLEPGKGRHEADGVVQRIPGRGQPVEPLIRDQLVASSWPKFLHPYPLSSKYFLVSCKPNPDALWGLYLVDVFDNMLLLHESPGYALLEPLPFRPTPVPPATPDRVHLDRDDATVYLADVYFGNGLEGVPRGTVKALRVFEYHYTYPQMGGHMHVGFEGPWDVHRILGTVPVFDDGSAMFKVPANTPIAVQPLDADGRALQLMRSWFTAMPGEVLSCVGCHERQNAGPPSRQTIAARRQPSEIAPWYGPTRGFSFKREVQPVLDEYCVGCHGGQAASGGQGRPDFTAKAENGWNNLTPSYLALHPYVRRPGPESDYHLLTPLEFHAGTSELVQMLEKGHHNVKLDDEAWDRLITWIDLNVPDHGTWHEHRAIPGNFHERRLEMRTRFANRPEDPEAIPDTGPGPVEFVAPQPQPAPAPDALECPGWPFDAADAQRRQGEAGLPAERHIDLGEGVSLDLVLIPAGQFVMGQAGAGLDEAPRAIVAVDKPFYMGRIEITNRQYRRFDPGHDSRVLDQHNKDHTMPGYPANGPDQPAIRVSWAEAEAFCSWLSERAGQACALPTEAQWEWACRAGADSAFSYGGLDSDFSGYANLADASVKLLAVAGINPQPIENPNEFWDFIPKDARFDDGQRLMCDVGQYQPNPWGLHDMHGNVCEWTRSLYAPYPYNAGDGRNEIDASGKRVCRGGSWRDRPKRARAAFRAAYEPYQRVYNVGFRVVCATE
ncbi:MAG: SUMF1/EgtB/PvdO family nonheme iron enzyme [Candidatus Hydrogenedentes bacterium]|nr:SUMF1/EgtB/PvdO family nonheme iron enzyme [Candidatus Hydrogenedentota bacterium]